MFSDKETISSNSVEDQHTQVERYRRNALIKMIFRKGRRVQNTPQKKLHTLQCPYLSFKHIALQGKSLNLIDMMIIMASWVAS